MSRVQRRFAKFLASGPWSCLTFCSHIPQADAFDHRTVFLAWIDDERDRHVHMVVDHVFERPRARSVASKYGRHVWVEGWAPDDWIIDHGVHAAGIVECERRAPLFRAVKGAVSGVPSR